jgi:hypothetical protein
VKRVTNPPKSLFTKNCMTLFVLGLIELEIRSAICNIFVKGCLNPI